MSHTPPTILVVHDSEYFRHRLRTTFENDGWLVHEWAPGEPELDLNGPPCTGLTAAVAEWRLGDSRPSGLQILSAIRQSNRLAACVLFTVQAGEEEWRQVSADAADDEILALAPDIVPPKFLFERVVKEVRRRQGESWRPRESWEASKSWLCPEPDPRLAQAVESVGMRHLVPLIQGLFPERGPERPIRYTFLSPGFSGARVFLLKDPPGNDPPGPRYILKAAQGNAGFEALEKECLRFQRSILGDSPQGQRFKGYVAEELRCDPRQGGPIAIQDWFAIAYREVGNGTGPVASFRDIYLEIPGNGRTSHQYRLMYRFLSRLFTDCLGHWSQHGARSATRRLWGEDADSGACYWLPAKKKLEIFAALDEMGPRAQHLLEQDGGHGNLGQRSTLEIIAAFIEKGRCSPRLAEPTLFHREFQVLEAGTHGDLHAGNVLAVDRQGELDPFLIDFSEYEERGHPFYDYARLENDIRLRLMNYEDGSDIVSRLLGDWLRGEEGLQALLEEPQAPKEEPPVTPGMVGFVEKGYWMMSSIRWLAYQNLLLRLEDQHVRPSKESFSAQYISALLHRTLISLASSDILAEKKILGLWLASNLIPRLGAIVGRL